MTAKRDDLRDRLEDIEDERGADKPTLEDIVYTGEADEEPGDEDLVLDWDNVDT